MTKNSTFILILFFLFSSFGAICQTPITGLTAVYKNETDDLNRYNANGRSYSFAVGPTNNLVIESIRLGTNEFAVKTVPDEVIVNRVNNTFTSGTRNIIFFEGSSNATQVNLRPSFKRTTEEVLISNVINRGVDNIFINTSETNTNNIERIDFLFYDGLKVPNNPADEGFLFLERGGNDRVKVAAITSLDSNNKPATFSSIVQIVPANFGTTTRNIATQVLNDNITGNLALTSNVANQNIAGTLVSFANFGLSAGDEVFGYIMVANDVTATTNAEILDITNTSIYPRNTNAVDGGVDLIAGGSVFVKAFVHNSGGWVDNPNGLALTCDDYIFVTGGNAQITGNLDIGHLYFDNGASLNLNGNTLNICRDLVVRNNPSTTSNSKIVFKGTETQNLEGEKLTVDNIEHNNTASQNLNISANVDLKETLKLTSGNINIENSSTFTFKSNASQTAVLSEVAPSSSISGCVTVERFIPASNRSYRYLSSPVNTTSACGKETIRDNLQEGFNVADYKEYPGTSESPGFGTHITGSKTGANGFDATFTANPSMYTWNQTTKRWNAVPNTNTKKLNVGESYSLMVRGGRELNLNLNNTQIGSTTTLRFTGELQSGNVSIGNLAQNNEEFSFIANPYQAQVDMKALLNSIGASNINANHMYIYDPNLGTQGGYAAIDLSTTEGTPAPIESSANKFLQPNQAVFIQNTDNSPTLTFGETFKKGVNQSFTTQTFSDANQNATLDISLKRKHNINFIPVDGVRMSFSDSFDNAVLSDDAIKFWNTDESLSIQSNDTNLSIERRQYPKSDQTIQLDIINYVGSEYQLIVNAEDLEKTVYLLDNYTGNLQKIENNTDTVYSFEVDKTNTDSKSKSRFELKFEETTLGVDDNALADVSVYPNPASTIVNVQIPRNIGGKANVQLLDFTGRLLSSESIAIENGLISTNKVEGFESGIYLIKVEVDNESFVKKIIIK